VVAYRLEHEHGVDAVFAPTSTVTARWLRGDETEIKQLIATQVHSVGLDVAREHVYLAPSAVSLMIMQERFKKIQFMKTRELEPHTGNEKLSHVVVLWI
jgi:peptide chain release factor 3